jgi:copper chaperone CopZ
MKTLINIDNLKCSGCAGTIKKGLQSFSEVSDVLVDIENSTVDVTYIDGFALENIKNKLHSMGYPESGTLQGFDKMATNAKSFVSCAIGKFSNDN